MKKFGIDSYEQYWDNRCAARHYKFTSVHHKIIDIVRELLGEKTARVLDCGVGPGHVYNALSADYKTFGLEISRKAFDLYDFNTENIKLWDLNKGLPVFDEKMDLVIASRIIHHLGKPASFIEQVRDVLLDNGWFIGVIPNICYYRHRLKYLFGKFPPVSSAHVTLQTGPDFQQMVTNSGLLLHKLTTPKRTLRAKLWPTVFSQDLVYVFKKIS
jgi:SAM-dependent methyltransferase